MKPCHTCKEPKSYTEYHKKTGARDGHQPTCIACHKARNRRRERKAPVDMDLTPENKKLVYTDVILRLKTLGIASEYTATKMLERVGGLS